MQNSANSIYCNVFCFQEDLATDITLDKLKNVKKIGFLGFGKSNRALFDYLRSQFPFEAVIRDEREKFDFSSHGVTLLLGEHCFEPCGEKLIFLSPSARRERECVRALSNGGSIFSSDAELFFAECKENILAVTGSDGKSTTSALSGLILEADGKKVFTAGNFGLPLTPLLGEKKAFFVTELSSFMLHYMKPRTRRSLITNITPNHLNWHADFGEYRRAKENILSNAEERVFFYDCKESQKLMKKYEAFAVFSVNESYQDLKKKIRAEVYATFEDGFFTLNGEHIFNREKFAPLGIHNVKNALAALCLTYGFCDTGAAVEAFRSFSGLPHRTRLIFEAEGMKYYDSSIDSSPERTRATLEVFKKPVTVILGGSDKGLDYSPLTEALREHAGAVILCGENALRLGRFIEKRGLLCPVLYVNDYREAIRSARDIGLDTVLSPASTSYDRFSNFEERGKEFLKVIEETYISRQLSAEKDFK